MFDLKAENFVLVEKIRVQLDYIKPNILDQTWNMNKQINTALQRALTALKEANQYHGRMNL